MLNMALCKVSEIEWINKLPVERWSVAYRMEIFLNVEILKSSTFGNVIMGDSSYQRACIMLCINCCTRKTVASQPFSAQMSIIACSIRIAWSSTDLVSVKKSAFGSGRCEKWACISKKVFVYGESYVRLSTLRRHNLANSLLRIKNIAFQAITDWIGISKVRPTYSLYLSSLCRTGCWSNSYALHMAHKISSIDMSYLSESAKCRILWYDK